MARIQQFDYAVDLMRAMLWQYNDAANLQSLMDQKQAWYNTNQTAFWEDWYRDVFNLETANDFGVAVWAIILNAPIYIVISPGSIRPTWGFGVPNVGFDMRFDDRFDVGEADTSHVNFNNGNFGTGGAGGIAGLTLENARLLLRLRYFNLTMRPTVPNINAFLNLLFADRGKVAVLDNYDMSITYSFLFPLPSVLDYVFRNWRLFDALPRPAGVDLDIQTVTRDTFGFGEFHDNFNNSNFGD